MVGQIAGFQLTGKAPGKAAALSLKPGMEVAATVVENRSDKVLRLAVGSSFVDVRASAKVPVGTAVTLSVSGDPGKPSILITPIASNPAVSNPAASGPTSGAQTASVQTASTKDAMPPAIQSGLGLETKNGVPAHESSRSTPQVNRPDLNAPQSRSPAMERPVNGMLKGDRPDTFVDANRSTVPNAPLGPAGRNSISGSSVIAATGAAAAQALPARPLNPLQTGREEITQNTQAARPGGITPQNTGAAQARLEGALPKGESTQPSPSLSSSARAGLPAGGALTDGTPMQRAAQAQQPLVSSQPLSSSGPPEQVQGQVQGQAQGQGQERQQLQPPQTGQIASQILQAPRSDHAAGAIPQSGASTAGNGQAPGFSAGPTQPASQTSHPQADLTALPRTAQAEQQAPSNRPSGAAPSLPQNYDRPAQIPSAPSTLPGAAHGQLAAKGTAPSNATPAGGVALPLSPAAHADSVSMLPPSATQSQGSVPVNAKGMPPSAPPAAASGHSPSALTVFGEGGRPVAANFGLAGHAGSNPLGQVDSGPEPLVASRSLADGQSRLQERIYPQAAVGSGSTSAMDKASVFPKGVPDAAARLLPELEVQQASLTGVFSAIEATGNAARAANLRLHEPLEQVMQQILGQRLGTAGKMSGQDVLQGVKATGLFRENALAKGALGQGLDLKTLLGQMRSVLVDLGVKSMAGRPLMQPPKPGLSVAPKGQGGAKSIPSPGGMNADANNLLARLMQETDQALARIRLTQLVNRGLAADDPHRVQAAKGPAMDLVMELPIVSGQETAVLQMQVGRDPDKDTPGEREGRGWRLRFGLDLTATGPLEAAISLRGGGTYVSLWIERKETYEALHAQRETIASVFADAGLDLEEFRLIRGLPISAKSKTGAVVDRHS